MPQHCTICTHRRRKAINAALLRLESYRDIAAEFGVSKDSLARHYHNHLVTEPEPEFDENEVGTATSATAVKQRYNSGAEAGSATREDPHRIAQNKKRVEQVGEPLDLREVAVQVLAEHGLLDDEDDAEEQAEPPRTATEVLTKANIENNSYGAVEPRTATQLMTKDDTEKRTAAHFYERMLDYWRRPFITLATRESLQQYCSDLTAAELDAALAYGLRRGELEKLMSVYVISSEFKAKLDAVTLGQH